MDTFVLNGFDFLDDPMNGTNAAIPMNGTNAAIPMNGTNAAIPMNGTNAAIPMQGTAGTFYVSPLALMDEMDVPMNGIPADYSIEDMEAYRVGYLTGDRDAMNGLFDKFKEKRAARKAERQEKREMKEADKAEKKALRLENKRIKTGKRASGTSFLDRFGGALANLGEAQKLKAEAERDLADEGIDFDDEVVGQRAAMASEAGVKSADGSGEDSGGFMGWFNSLSTPQKVGGALAVAGLGYGAYKLFTGKKRKK
jgi:hypothetical protein